MKRLIQMSKLFLILALFAGSGCVKSNNEDQLPSNRDGVSDGSEDRADKPSEGQTPSNQTPPPEGGKRNQYTIQMGIFDNREAADQLAFELRAKNINCFTQQVDRRWRVCVGRYYSKGRAERTLRQLIQMGFNQAMISTPQTAP